jgi:NADH-quinone oxidoreductase subunit G
MCIDICPVGALTSGIYRYKTRPWEMEHVGTICTHCSNGCKTTLGVRNNQIIRGNNRDRSGINGEFLCIKGRYGFDFCEHPDRLQSPMARMHGKLEPVSWSEALATVARKFGEVKERGGKFGVIGSNHTTNEENYYLQKFARRVMDSNNIDHHRTGDLVGLLNALSGRQGRLASTADLYERKAVLVVAADLALEQPFLSYQVRANFRHHQARVYVVTVEPVREDKYAAVSLRCKPGEELARLESLRDRLKTEPELVILFGDAIRGEALGRLVEYGESLGVPVQYVCCLDYSNSRGAVDMTLVPDWEPGLTLPEMLDAEHLDALWIVGANPLKSGAEIKAKEAFVVVNDLFLTETAQRADVVFPAASVYEKSGTVTNVCGEVQRLKRALQVMGTKPDLEIIGLVAKEMGQAALMGPWLPDAVFEEIRKTVRGYHISPALLAAGSAAQTVPLNGRPPAESRPELIRSAHNDLFNSGTLGRYCKILHSVVESRPEGQ